MALYPKLALYPAGLISDVDCIIIQQIEHRMSIIVEISLFLYYSTIWVHVLTPYSFCRWIITPGSPSFHEEIYQTWNPCQLKRDHTFTSIADLSYISEVPERLDHAGTTSMEKMRLDWLTRECMPNSEYWIHDKGSISLQVDQCLDTVRIQQRRKLNWNRDCI